MTVGRVDAEAPRSSRGIPGWPVVLIIAIGFVAQFFTWLEGDVAWLLTVARRMNAGSVLYSRDLVEFNPPLVMQFSQIAVLMAGWLHVSTALAWRVMVASFASAAWLLSWRLLRDALVHESNDLRASYAVLLAAALACLPGLMFGQREHLVVLGFVPYLIASGLRAAHVPITRMRGAVVGIALSLAVSIKPHYALAIPLVELAVCRYQRTWRSLIRTDSVAGALSLLVVQGLAAIQFPGYLSFAVPLALNYYQAYGNVHVLPSYVVYLAGAVAALAVPGLPRHMAIQRTVFMLGATGAIGAYILQGQGWEYQFLPAQTFLILVVGITGLPHLVGLLERMRPDTVSAPRTVVMWTWLACMVAAVAVATTVRTVRINRHERARIVTNVRDTVQRTWPPGRPHTMASMTLSLFPASPVAELIGAEWASRFSCLWLLPGITEHERAVRAGTEQPKDGRAYLESAVVEDFARWRPTLVLVEREQPRVLDEILKASAFRDEWRHYRSAGVVESVEVFVREP